MAKIFDTVQNIYRTCESGKPLGLGPFGHGPCKSTDFAVIGDGGGPSGVIIARCIDPNCPRCGENIRFGKQCEVIGR